MTNETTEPAQPQAETSATTPVASDENAEDQKPTKRGSITAQLMTRPSFMGAHTAMSFVPDSMTAYGPAHILSMFDQFHKTVKDVVDGDMTGPEALLIAQAMSLNSIYNQCASLAGSQLDSRSTLPVAESLMRMALKAQAQCTQTLRVLGELKVPKSVAFIKQQNNAAGHQQINNGPAPVAGPHAHEEKAIQSNELLTDNREAQHAATLDTGATGSAGPGDQALAAVEVVNRADD